MKKWVMITNYSLIAIGATMFLASDTHWVAIAGWVVAAIGALSHTFIVFRRFIKYKE